MNRATRRFAPITDRVSMLGTMAHRATLMSFRRQWSGGELARFGIVAKTAAHTELLVAAASAPDAAEPASLFRCIVDPDGPFWGSAADDWANLDDDDRRWVLNALPEATDQAAHMLAKADRAMRYRTLRSEVRLNRLDSTDGGQIADLIGVTQRGRVVLIDLKFVHGHLPVSTTRSKAHATQIRDQLKLVRDHLRDLGSARCTRRVEGWLLYIDYRDHESAWERVR